MLRRVHVHVCSMNVHKNVIFIGFDGKASSTTNELKIKKLEINTFRIRKQLYCMKGQNGFGASLFL